MKDYDNKSFAIYSLPKQVQFVALAIDTLAYLDFLDKPCTLAARTYASISFLVQNRFLYGITVGDIAQPLVE